MFRIYKKRIRKTYGTPWVKTNWLSKKRGPLEKIIKRIINSRKKFKQYEYEIREEDEHQQNL